jgi:hypothetical protein
LLNDELKGFFAAAAGNHIETIGQKSVTQNFAHQFVIIDNKYLVLFAPFYRKHELVNLVGELPGVDRFGDVVSAP